MAREYRDKIGLSNLAHGVHLRHAKRRQTPFQIRHALKARRIHGARGSYVFLIEMTRIIFKCAFSVAKFSRFQPRTYDRALRGGEATLEQM